MALDFDFEAPGLHYKLNISPSGKRTGDAIPERGAVDYLLAAIQGEGPPKKMLDFVVSVPLPRGTEGALQLIPAGSAPTGEYWRKLTTLLHQDLFADPEGSGIAACLDLKLRIEEALRADFLLIDSRTGVTEFAGVTTTVLADKVVCLMLANRESQTGARAVLRSLKHAARLEQQAPVEVIPILSRVPEHDDSLAREALAFLNEPGPTPEDTLALERSTCYGLIQSSPAANVCISAAARIKAARLSTKLLQVMKGDEDAEVRDAAYGARSSCPGT